MQVIPPLCLPLSLHSLLTKPAFPNFFRSMPDALFLSCTLSRRFSRVWRLDKGFLFSPPPPPVFLPLARSTISPPPRSTAKRICTSSFPHPSFFSLPQSPFSGFFTLWRHPLLSYLSFFCPLFCGAFTVRVTQLPPLPKPVPPCWLCPNTP